MKKRSTRLTGDGFWRGKPALVTGAGGFIGSHLVEALLERGARVRALIHYNSRNHWGHLERYARRRPANLEVVAGDVTDGFFVRELVRGRRYVFHLAALIPIPYSYKAPGSYVQANVVGTQNLLEACRLLGVERMVHTSTSEVYGTARYVPMDEGHPLSAQSPYAATKTAADQLALSYHRSFGTPVLVARPFNCFGPRQSARAVIPTILTSLLRGERELSLGALSPVRDLTFVEDTARGFLRAAQKGLPGEVYHIGQGKGWSVRELVSRCADAVGAPPPRVRQDAQRLRPAKSEVHRLICTAAKLRRLGWKPEVSLDEGLRRTAVYLRENLAEYKPAYQV